MGDALTTTAARHDVLATQTWPNGLCPIHTWEGTGARCSEPCMAVGVAFKQLSDEYDLYWAGLDVQRTLRRRREMESAA